nr:hypothetical protein CFP56_66875 [Quercus suber]
MMTAEKHVHHQLKSRVGLLERRVRGSGGASLQMARAMASMTGWAKADSRARSSAHEGRAGGVLGRNGDSRGTAVVVESRAIYCFPSEAKPPQSRDAQGRPFLSQPPAYGYIIPLESRPLQVGSEGERDKGWVNCATRRRGGQDWIREPVTPTFINLIPLPVARRPRQQLSSSSRLVMNDQVEGYEAGSLPAFKGCP